MTSGGAGRERPCAGIEELHVREGIDAADRAADAIVELDDVG